MNTTAVESRPYQDRIVQKTLDMFAGTHRDGKGDLVPAARSVMIESPTGSGKTCMGLMIARQLQQQVNARVGWVAMQRNLLDQVKAENKRHGFGVDLRTISMFDKSPPTDIDLLITDECQQLNALLRSRGVASDVITGSTDRESQLAAFRSGGLQVLVNCMVLAEGFDDPSLRTVWARPSGKGPTIQMGGRVLRRFGDTVKQVVQCCQTRHPFVRTALPRQSYLWQCGQWQSLEINPRLSTCNENVRMAVAQMEVMLPKFLDRKRRRPRRASRQL